MDYREYCYELVNRVYNNVLEFRWMCLLEAKTINRLPITKTIINNNDKPYLLKMVEKELKRVWWLEYNELTPNAIEELEWFTLTYLNIFNLATEYRTE